MNRPYHFSSTFLESWPEAWRHTEVWLALSRDAAALPGEAAFDALVGSWTNPPSPIGAWEALLEQGEFAAADALLRYPPARASIQDRRLKQLSRQLRAQRDLTVGQLRTRCQQLRWRAERLRAKALISERVLLEILAEAEMSLPLALDGLGHLESKLEGLIREKVALLSTSLEERLESLESEGYDVESGHISTWAAHIDGLLRAGEVSVAEQLLQLEPYDQSLRAVGPSEVPRLPSRFPREGRTAAEICEWFLPGGETPAWFAHNWQPLTDDLTVLPLMERLKPIFEDRDGFTVLGVLPMLAALEQFFDLGDLPEITDVPPYRHGFVCVRLRGLYSEWLLPFNPTRFPDGIQLAIPYFHAVSDEPAPEFLEPLSVLLDPWHWVPRRPVDMLELEDEAIFLLTRDRRYRKLNLLRELGAQMPLELAFPEEYSDPFVIAKRWDDALGAEKHFRPDGPGIFLPRSFVVLRSWAANFFDMLGIGLQRTEHLDRLVYYSGGDGILLILQLQGYIQQLLRAQREERPILREEDIEQLWYDDESDFRAHAEALILEHLRTRPLQLAICAYLNLEGLTREVSDDVGITPDELKDGLESWGVRCDELKLASEVEQLVAQGLLEGHAGDPPRISITRDPIGLLFAWQDERAEALLAEARVRS